MFTSRRKDGPAGRSMVIGRGGMICTSQPLATFAGAQVLRGGGNAVDAAVSAAAVLGVVEPYSTGVGGDCFMLIWSAADQKLHGLNGSGRAPRRASLEALREKGLREMPMHGMLPVTIPGALDAWSQAVQRFGRRTLADALAPAIEYAAEGFPVSEIIAHEWQLTFGLLQQPEARRTFSVEGRAPHVGETVRLPGLATTLRAIASGGAEAFYAGDIARQIVALSAEQGGWHDLEDFSSHRSTWVEPISTDYRGLRVCELPPSTQGVTVLLALNILECFDLAAPSVDDATLTHLRIEALKLAFADRNRYLGDPKQASVPTGELLSKDYAQGRAALLDASKVVTHPQAGRLPVGTDTVYLTAADAEGNVVSLINSLFFPFGSGMVVGDTGIALQNRGFGFSTDPGHPNCLAPGKRPFHTIIPAMILENGVPVVSFGVMGGDMQAQGHVQVVSNLRDLGCNIQEAIDAPRFHYLETDRVALERGLAAHVGAKLAALGHVVEDETAALPRGGFGGGQGIMIDHATHTYWGGSDRRKDGAAIGF